MDDENTVAAWLVVFSEIDGLRWVLATREMAFSPGACQRAMQIKPEDELILYVSRGAFHNPTRDQSQILGLAVVRSAVKPLPRAFSIRGRRFTCGCALRIRVLLPEREGIPVAPLVPRLSFIRRKAHWGHYMRAGLIRLPRRDATLLKAKLQEANKVPS